MSMKLFSRRREIQSLLKALQNELDQIEQHPDFKKDQEFVEKLDALLNDNGKSLADAVRVLSPHQSSSLSGPGAPTGRRKKMRYKNPHTNEVVDSAGANNTILKRWKKEYPGEDIKSWIIGEA